MASIRIMCGVIRTSSRPAPAIGVARALAVNAADRGGRAISALDVS
jgi:hypothetical protein